MTSPRRTKSNEAQCLVQSLDWDSPSAATGTVKRRRSSHEDCAYPIVISQDEIFDAQTPSDSGSGTSKSVDDNEKSDSLIDVEERISCIINESRSSVSNSESSDIEVAIDNILSDPIDIDFNAQNDSYTCDRSKTFIKSENIATNKEKGNISNANSQDKRNKDRRLKTPIPIKKNNKTFDIIKPSPKQREIKNSEEKSSVLPVYKSTIIGTSLELNTSNQKKKGSSKLRLPFTPTKTMEKPKINFFQNKGPANENKPSPLLSSPVRRTISNEYVRLKFTNDTVIRRTIDGKSVRKITPKIQSIIPESPVDTEDPFLNLSPNKKYTVTVNNKVRCDKDNYVIFDPETGFDPAGTTRQSRIPLKSPSTEKSRIPLKSPTGENSGIPRKSANVSDTDSGILSPNSPVDTSERGATYYVNAVTFSETVKKCASEYDIKILDPGLAKKATEQIQVIITNKFYS